MVGVGRQRIVGFEAGESKALLDYLFDLYERTLDIQVRFKWTPRTSALWDNVRLPLSLVLSSRRLVC